ncbi:Importin beta-related nuclear transport receptor [Ceratocystis lukuohia]|uniref:Uncharacterized protein n=2 Tax=Ceratocystis TaxID=5157 RepID=A0A0F8CP57_CERFI|nr:hypothetical protein CFO_g5135 [Ceratocystis platani]
MARTAEDQVDVTMMEIIDLAMTNETGQTEAEEEEEALTEARQPETRKAAENTEGKDRAPQSNQEPMKGKQSGRTTERERNLSLAHKYIAAQKKQATAESESEPETESEPAQPCQDAC